MKHLVIDAGDEDIRPLAETAVTFWRSRAGSAEPSAVKVLKAATRKSTVLRLLAANSDGSSVVVKCCPIEVARREELVYRSLLRPIGVSAPECYGCYDTGDGLGWLFLEDVGDNSWSDAEPAHKRLASEWLASVHLRAIPFIDKIILPDRGADYFRGVTVASIATLEAVGGRVDLSAEMEDRVQALAVLIDDQRTVTKCWRS